MASQPTSRITVEEYLAAEEKSEVRHEYWNGNVVAMAGASPTHGDIISNLNLSIRQQTFDSGCYVRATDMRVRTAANGLYTYPDLVISCKSQFDHTTLLNPCALVEVLSDSTADYDRGSKFERYRHISSFQEYVCVAQDRLYVEHHVRSGSDPDIWTMREYLNLSDQFTITLPTRQSGDALQTRLIVLKISDIYRDLELGFEEK